MNIEPVAYYHGPFPDKFGLPRQSGLAAGIRGTVVFARGYSNAAALRGLEDFSHIWLVWDFSENEGWQPTVRPPRLGGNRTVGVFASRSPFRPNGLGLSAVKLEAVDFEACTLAVSGADLVDGTPIYDVKPYIAYCDAILSAKCGFVDSVAWKPLEVDFPVGLQAGLAPQDVLAIKEALSMDPRPHYHNEPGRIYGMRYGYCLSPSAPVAACGPESRPVDVRFRVGEGRVSVVEVVDLDPEV